MKFLIFIFTILLLNGCMSTEPIIVTKEIKIPVYQVPDIPERDLPELPVSKLTSSSTDKEVAIAYDKTINILIEEVKYYKNVIKNLKK